MPAHPDDGAHPHIVRANAQLTGHVIAIYRDDRGRLGLHGKLLLQGFSWGVSSARRALRSASGAASPGAPCEIACVCQPLFPTSPFGNLALPASAGGPLSLQRFPSGERAPALWQRAPGAAGVRVCVDVGYPPDQLIQAVDKLGFRASLKAGTLEGDRPTRHEL